VEALNLAGRGRRAGRGQQVSDAVVLTHPIEQHLTAAVPESVREYLAIVSEDLRGRAVIAQRQRQRVTGGARGGAGNYQRADTEARVIIDTGDDLGFGAVDKTHTA
jgi:hypothetical protein